MIKRRVVSEELAADPDGGNRRVEVTLSCGHKTRRTLKANRPGLDVSHLRCHQCERAGGKGSKFDGLTYRRKHTRG